MMKKVKIQQIFLRGFENIYFGPSLVAGGGGRGVIGSGNNFADLTRDDRGVGGRGGDTSVPMAPLCKLNLL